jgi:predicted DNA-binding transcriptional regulator YafY
MAKKRKPSPAPATTGITTTRAARLYDLLALIGEKPQTRAVLTRRLKLGLRAFYRDLKALRKVGVRVDLVGGHYVLEGTAATAQARLLFPDPKLTLGEAQQLARGRTAAHRKLKGQIEKITG